MEVSAANNLLTLTRTLEMSIKNRDKQIVARTYEKASGDEDAVKELDVEIAGLEKEIAQQQKQLDAVNAEIAKSNTEAVLSTKTEEKPSAEKAAPESAKQPSLFAKFASLIKRK